MSTIVQCACGSSIRLPEGVSRRGLRCPICKAGLALTAQGQLVPRTAMPAGTAAAMCPICQTAVSVSEQVVFCPVCRQVHHGDCWSEMGGCGTYSCAEAPAFEKAEPGEAPAAGWGDVKKCPFCGETIRASAVRCRYCKADFQTADPVTLHDVLGRSGRKKEASKAQGPIIVYFGASLLGVFCLITLLIGLFYFLPQRKRLAKTVGPIYQVLIYSGLGVSILYCVLFLFMLGQ